MPDQVRRMVLRSINLPPELDDQLRAVAFVLRRPKSDLIRMFVADGLMNLMKHLEAAPDQEMPKIVDQLSHHVEETGRPYSAEETKRIAQDFARIQRFIDRGAVRLFGKTDARQ
jgi:predicted DNA-binding protein